MVISRYKRIAGYDWIAIPLVPYLYAVENPEDVPLYATPKLVAFLRDQYRQRSYGGDRARRAERRNTEGRLVRTHRLSLRPYNLWFRNRNLIRARQCSDRLAQFSAESRILQSRLPATVLISSEISSISTTRSRCRGRHCRPRRKHTEACS